jgi:hypothetical protein
MANAADDRITIDVQAEKNRIQRKTCAADATS